MTLRRLRSGSAPDIFERTYNVLVQAAHRRRQPACGEECYFCVVQVWQVAAALDGDKPRRHHVIGQDGNAQTRLNCRVLAGERRATVGQAFAPFQKFIRGMSVYLSRATLP